MSRDQHENLPVAVGIGLIRRGDRFLIRQRPDGSAMAGYWEFPGGKCEPGESPAEATIRECREETGLAVIVVNLRRVIRHQYPHAWVELSYYDCETCHAADVPDPTSGFRWVVVTELLQLQFPDANESIVSDLAHEFGRPA